MDLHAIVTGDESVMYPGDYGLPECPEPSHDPGFAPGESPTQEELEAAPECAVHPRMAVSMAGMETEAAGQFFEAYGCGQTAKRACQREDL